MRPESVTKNQTENMPTMLLSLLIVILCFLSTCLAQIATDKLDADQLFLIAREKAFAGEREEARRLCKIIIDRSPSYLDAKILLARTYAWDGQWNESRALLKAILQEKPTYKDAIDALVDVELWDKDFARALEIANQGLSSYPRDEDLLLKKARALNNLGRDEEALLVLLKLEQMNPSRSEVVALRESISVNAMLNGVGVSYALDRFSEVYDAMNYVSVQLSRRMPYGSLFARLNCADRFNSQGLQVEADLYPRIGDGVYAYLNYGFSQSTLFPKHRFGAEIYTKLPSSFEGSVGLRHLFFDASSKVTIYTGTIGYYVGNYWLSFRPYFTPRSAGISNSASLTMRRYIGDAETYVSLHAGAGFSADERLIQSSTGFAGQELFFLKSQTVGVGWQQSIGSTSLLLATLDVANQELSFNPGSYVTMYSLSIAFRTRF
jgi:YaiO family outer membrane protein